MSNKINSVKEKLINDYIKKIDMAIDNYNSAIEPDEEIVNLLIITLYLIFDYPYKYYTFKLFEV